MMAGAGAAAGLSVGICSTVQAAQEEGLMTAEQVDRVLSRAAQDLSGAGEVPPGHEVVGSAAACEKVLARVRESAPALPTKSGLMLGLGESAEEIREVMRELRSAGVELLTLGQYLRPSREHLPVARFVEPTEFEELAEEGRAMGFAAVASAPYVRSSYHAREMHEGE